jgi:ATP-dependent helicase HrpB
MSLPIEGVLERVREAARARRNIVIEASPGAGKTTRVPPALGEIVERVVVLEPRRLAARLAATRVAAERGLRLGEEVGYQIRFEDRTSERTRLTYLTEGVLTRRLMRDPELVGIDCVVLDEIHERHLHGDLALALLARLRARRPELFVVAMSATLDAAPIAALLDAVTIRCEGHAFEVDVEERAIGRDELDVAVAKAARALARDPNDGHILAFLPGAAEIRRAAERCGALARDERLRVLPLHGSLSAREQDEAVAPSSERKLVLATNVAESSITIEGVTGVIDSGLAKVARQRPNAALPELRLAPISQASARQRAGRAGRTAPGRCIRLYTDLSRRPAFDEPEITRSDLAELRLVLALSGIEEASELAWLTPPPAAALAAAEALLTAIGALEGNQPTPLGRSLARLPLPPRLGRVLLEARRRGVGERAAALLALLGETRGTTDLWRALDRFERGAEAPGSVDRARRQILRSAERLPRAARGEARDPNSADLALEAALVSGFPDRVARRLEGSEERGALKLALSEGGVALLADREAVGPEGLTLAIEARHTQPGQPARIELAAAIHLDTLLDQSADRITLEEELIFDEARGRVESLGRMRHGRIVLEESRARATPSAATARLLLEAARRRGLFERDDLTRLRARLRFARQGDASLPSFDDDVLAGILERLATTTSRLADLEAMPLATLVTAEIGLDERALAKLAPTRIRLAGGAELVVRYPAHAPPYVESYLQDFFGMPEGPRAGATPLVLELWAPNRRPIQITQDLASFWRTHYPELRRQLARRYPKHHWPDDPLAAPAKRFVRPR